MEKEINNSMSKESLEKERMDEKNEELRKKEVESIAKKESLKKEFERIGKRIADEDDYTLESTNKAINILSSLNVLTLEGKSQSDETTSSSSKPRIPDAFYCPLSGYLMNDPVLILSTGQTYDRKFIESWLKDGNNTCPQTERVLSDIVFIPNNIVQLMILRWHESHELPYPDYDFENMRKADRDHLNELLHKIDSTSDSAQEEAAEELLDLTWQRPYSRVLFGEIKDSITLLLNRHSKSHDYKSDFYKTLITIIFNLSLHESNKKSLVESSLSLHFLFNSLTFGNIEAKQYAAASISRLSSLDSNKHIILENGALIPLLTLLQEGHPLVRKDTVSAIRNLFRIIGTKDRDFFVSEGAVRIIMKKLTQWRYLADDLLGILERFSSTEKAMQEMKEFKIVHNILEILKENNVSDSIKENCLEILHWMCLKKNDDEMLVVIKNEEDVHLTFYHIASSGTEELKEKANRLRELFHKYDKGD